MTTPSVENLGAIFAEPAAYADPAAWHATAKRIREESPILRVTVADYPEFWAITTHADVMTVERNPEVFTNSPLPTLAPTDKLEAAANVPVKTLIQMDGDQHKAHRNIVNDWFKPGNLKALQDRIDELARRSVDHMATLDGRCDFVTDVALQFPLQVILSILGLPEQDYPRMLKLTQELFGAEDPDIGRMGEDDETLGVILDFVSYFTDLAAARRAGPTGDLASVIANAEIDGQPLADLDMMGHYMIIATAGHDTTSNAIGGGMLALIEQPEQLALLRARPEWIDNAADEFVRWTSPVKHFARTCQAPFTIRDVTFQPGDLLYLSYASANRDEEVFPDAMRLDVTRENAANHLAFGFGRHFCLGAHLARMEIRALFKELLGRLDHIELAGEPTWIKAYFVEGPKSIPITYELTGSSTGS
jgi:cytochrome P450